MAIVDTIPTVTLTRQPFETPPQVRTMWSLVPRALVHFAVDGAALDAKPINDDQHLRISAVLPAGFAYQFMQIGMSIEQDVAAAWTTRPILRMVNWTPNATHGAHMVLVLELADEFADASAVSPVKVMRGLAATHPLGRQIIFSSGVAAISFSLLASNEADPAGAAGTVDFFASFLAYDLNQAVRFGIQSPIPVVQR